MLAYANYYYEIIARNNNFWWALEIDFRYETKARKVMVHCLHKVPLKVGLIKELTVSCIGGWNSACQPYIKSATALYEYYIDDEEIARISGLCQAAERHFQSLGGPRNVSVDLKYDVLCL